MEINKNNRKGYLDIAKAIGVIIVLINHIGLSLAGANKFLGAFYVSEFFVIAGMTFRIKPKENIKDFAKKKAKRLLFPYVAYSIFFVCWYVVRSFFAGNFSGQDMIKKIAGCMYARNYLFVAKEEPVYLMEIMNAPMWFLPALFFSLVLYFFLSTRFRKYENKRVYGVFACLFLGMLFHYVVQVLLPWSIDVALIMQPLLFFGEKLSKIDYVEQTRRKFWILPVTLFLFIVVVSFNGTGNCSVGDYGFSVLLFLLASFLGTFLCIMFSFLLERYLLFLAKGFIIVGKSTLTILCLHLFVFALVQTALGVIGINTNKTIVQWSIVVLGLFTPIIFEKIMEKVIKTYKRDL